MDTAKLAGLIREINNVKGTNVWEKGGHSRLYIEIKSQNRVPNASKIYVDLNTGAVVTDLRKGQSGAKSYAWSVDVAKAVNTILAENSEASA